MPKVIPEGAKIIKSELIDPSLSDVLNPHKRPPEVEGKTYKVQPPIYEEALYITINHITLADGTLRPIEVFINSKHMESFQWITGLTRVLSALFRQPQDFTFIIDELKQVFDPHGEYFIPGSGGKKAKSVVAHVAIVIEEHCRAIGFLRPQELDSAAQEAIKEKLKGVDLDNEVAQECPKCHERSVYKFDGCPMCITCGHSECG